MNDGTLRTSSPRPLRLPGATPAVPKPWNMAQWRRSWGAFWGPANREAIRQAMARGL